MAYSVPSTQTTGDLITAAIWNQNVVSNVLYLYGARGILNSQIAYSALGSDSTFSFTSLSGAYDDLFIFMLLRSDYTVSTTESPRIRFNNDSGANYNYSKISNANTTVAGVSAVGQSSLTANLLFVNNAHANYSASSFSSLVMHIPRYASTANTKTARINAGTVAGATAADMSINDMIGNWNSTVAISRIDIVPTNGTNWKTGSTVAIYGGDHST